MSGKTAELEWAERVRQSADEQVAEGAHPIILTDELFAAREGLGNDAFKELGNLGLRIVWRTYGQGELLPATYRGDE